MELPQPGAVFATKYRLDAVLGRGGFATVYKASDAGANRTVAVKILDPQGDSYRFEVESRFHREVRVIANLRDPHTVTMFDFGRSDEGLLFMVFEYLPGADLAELISTRGRLDEASTVHVLRQVLSSLREAHQAGLLHRDLKPENIRIFEYMGDPLRATVLDFGIAKPTGSTAVAEAGITNAGALVGTPHYMSPEQLLGQTLTPASDIYSVGLVTFEMLTGRRAVQGNAIASQLHVLAGATDLALPADVPVSVELRNLVDQMMKRDVAARPQSASEVLAALDAIAATRSWGGVATPASAPRESRPNAARFPAPLPAPPMPAAAPPARDSTTPGLLLVALLGLIALATFVVWILVQRDASDDAPRALPAGLTQVTQRPAPPPDSAPQPDPAPVVAEPAPPPPANVAPEEERNGCGRAADFEGLGTIELTRGLSLTRYTVYLPTGYDPNRRHPLLVMFHDVDSGPTRLLEDTRMARRADRDGFVILLPEDKMEFMEGPWMDGEEDLRQAVRGIDAVRETLCIDDARIFAFGHGAGGRAADALPCHSPRVRATATTSFRYGGHDSACRSDPPVPRIEFAPLQDGHAPPQGGDGCEAAWDKATMAIPAHEQLRRDGNGCGERKEKWRKERLGTCFIWTDGCAAPYVSCHVDGGRNWPGSKRRDFDLAGCDGPSVNFGYADKIWAFFDEFVPGADHP